MSKLYYNGVLLPEIPADVLAECPYAVIVSSVPETDETELTYILVVSKASTRVGMDSETAIIGPSEATDFNMYQATSESDDWTLVTSQVNETFMMPVNTVTDGYISTLIWTNHDLYIVEAGVNTELYFAATEPTTEPPTGEDTLYSIYESTLTEIADALREKTGKTELISVTDMAGEIRGIQGGGGGVEEMAALIEGSPLDISNNLVYDVAPYVFCSAKGITSVDLPNCSTIGTSAFQNCTNLKNISFPACTSTGNNVFQNCYKLTSASFPKATIVGTYNFYSCSALTTADFPVATSIPDGTFLNCSSLTSASFPKASLIGGRAFYSCSKLISADFPECTLISQSAFYGCYSLSYASFPKCSLVSSTAFWSCSSLATIYFPVCTSLSYYAFHACKALTTADFPACKTVGSYVFNGCSSLSFVNLPVCTSVNNYAFQNCSSLTTLIMGASSVATLGGSAAFRSTPMSVSTYTGSFGSIYVPASLVDAYKAASNWSVYSDRITAIT